MSLFSTLYDPDTTVFNLRSLRAGDAPAMLTFLAAEVAAALAAGEEALVEVKLAGAASGYDWECWLATAATDEIGALTVFCPLNVARFVCAVAGNPAEAREKLAAQLAAVSPENVFKIEVAGAGDGPRYMALALYNVGA